MQAATVWDRLFDTALIYDWQAPLGQHDVATGIWTCPQEGLYAIQPVVEVPAFPNPGSRIYEATCAPRCARSTATRTRLC